MLLRLIPLRVNKKQHLQVVHLPPLDPALLSLWLNHQTSATEELFKVHVSNRAPGHHLELLLLLLEEVVGCCLKFPQSTPASVGQLENQGSGEKLNPYNDTRKVCVKKALCLYWTELISAHLCDVCYQNTSVIYFLSFFEVKFNSQTSSGLMLHITNKYIYKYSSVCLL